MVLALLITGGGVARADEPRAATVTNPSWIVRPMPDTPRIAQWLDIRGRVTVNCTVTVFGHLTNCEVVEEQPSGVGFGEAALASMATGLLRPQAVDGEPRQSRIQFAYTFEIHDESEPGPADDPTRLRVDVDEAIASATPRARDLARRVAKSLPPLDEAIRLQGLDAERRPVVEAWAAELMPWNAASMQRMQEGMLLYAFDEAQLEAMLAGRRPLSARPKPAEIFSSSDVAAEAGSRAARDELRRRYCERWSCEIRR